MAEKKENFEKNLKELEEVVKSLESGNVGLDDMLSLFERGIKLTKSCTKLLDEAEQKINVLVKGENGELVEEKFEGLNN